LPQIQTLRMTNIGAGTPHNVAQQISNNNALIQGAQNHRQYNQTNLVIEPPAPHQYFSP